MATKKKMPTPKGTEKRRTQEIPVKSEGKNGRAGGPLSARGKAGASAAAQPAAERTQMESFRHGMRLFHERKFEQAREAFWDAARGPDRAVTDRATLHARMCERRIETPAVVLKTAEDHYNYAVTLINARDLTGAQQHLQAALAADPGADHVLYALAATQSLAGDLQGAYENLRRAIDLQPRNRLAARQDPDFAALAEQPAFARLLYPDRK
jgi:tetratricopeptide (TPR) repeat protein